MVTDWVILRRINNFALDEIPSFLILYIDKNSHKRFQDRCECWISFPSYLPHLNISTGHWTMSGKKLIYVRWRLVYNEYSCPPWSENSEAFSKHRPLVLVVFMNILIDNLQMQLFHVPNRKIFYTNTLLLFLPYLRQLLLWKHFICHYIALTT